jgi:hypothetical protein
VLIGKALEKQTLTSGSQRPVGETGVHNPSLVRRLIWTSRKGTEIGAKATWERVLGQR